MLSTEAERLARRLNEAIENYRENNLKQPPREIERTASPIFFPFSQGTSQDEGGYVIVRAEARDEVLVLVTKPWAVVPGPMKPGQIFREFEIDHETALDEVRSIVEVHAETGEEVEAAMYY